MENLPTRDCNRETAGMYLDLLKRSLVRWGDEEFVPFGLSESRKRKLLRYVLRQFSATRDLELVHRIPFDPDLRANGRDWPIKAETMIGLKRLDNIEHCIKSVIKDDVGGDLVETGVWRGGASIFMRAVLKAEGEEGRTVWCADSFEGLPEPDIQKYPQDKDVIWHKQSLLAVSLEEVKANFRKYGLLDDRVKFLKGWFRDTLHSAPMERIAVLRLDGDMYESTMDALCALYDRVEPGGFIIVDDYGIPEDTCRLAVDDFRSDRGITDEIVDIDGFGVFWRRSSQTASAE